MARTSSRPRTAAGKGKPAAAATKAKANIKGKAAANGKKAAVTKKATPAKGAKKTRATKNSPADGLTRADSLNTQLRDAISELTSEPQATTSSAVVSTKGKKNAQPPTKSKSYKLDTELACSVPSGAKVYQDYSVMLNQTNIGQNNNKFYVIQIAEHSKGKKFTFFTRWGRVGETGQQARAEFSDPEAAIKEYQKKFKDKTKKYTALEMDEESDDDEDVADGPPAKKLTKIDEIYFASQLNDRTLLLARLIFSDNMFEQQMAEMQLDVKKMPLGKLSKSQIARGLEALLDLEEAIKNKKAQARLPDLTSRFYTLIPHNFGRTVPPVISSLPLVQQKKEVLITLSDIELTQTLQKNAKQTVPTVHPMDAKMQSLGCFLEYIDKKTKEFKWIDEYSKACPNTRQNKLLDVWRVDRSGEGYRFNNNNTIKHRKLLWHGTNVAVVAAILNSGLRIMPHSGGRVGRGIYFASEHAKSSFYVGCNYGSFEGEQNVGFMFLVEVALGAEKNITDSSGSQTKAPLGFDSIVARGSTEPDPKADMVIEIEGNKVIVPKGKPKNVPEYKGSNFSQSEYLVYREDQARMRYLLKYSFA